MILPITAYSYLCCAQSSFGYTEAFWLVSWCLSYIEVESGRLLSQLQDGFMTERPLRDAHLSNWGQPNAV